jgi:hypothetical protein
MPRKNKPEWEKRFMNSWQMLFCFALVLLLIAYGFASWAIDSGNLLHYLLTIVFLVWAAKEIKRGIKVLLHK